MRLDWGKGPFRLQLQSIGYSKMELATSVKSSCQGMGGILMSIPRVGGCLRIFWKMLHMDWRY